MATFRDTTHDDGLPTHSTYEQAKTEEACRAFFEEWLNPDGSLSRESCAAASTDTAKRSSGTHTLPRPWRALTTCFVCAVRA